MGDCKDFQKRVLARAKAKNQTEHEQLFEEYRQHLLDPLPAGLKYTDCEQKRLALTLAIMDSGIFWRGQLKGRKLSTVGPVRYQTYPLEDIQHFLSLLVEDYFESQPEQVEFEEVMRIFERDLRTIADAVIYAGAPRRQVNKIHNNWLEIFAEKVRKDGPPWWWFKGYESEEEIPPFHESLFGTLIFAAPNAPRYRIAKWVNSILKAFGKQPIKDRTLRNQISLYLKSETKLTFQELPI